MSSASLQILHLVVIITLCCKNEFGLALRVGKVQESLHEIFQDRLNVTCTVDGPAYWSKKIVTIEMRKKDEKPIAILWTDQIVKGPGMKSNMRVDGYVDKEGASPGFLRVMIEKPSRKDEGTYVCRIFYLDESFEVKEETASSNITVEDYDGAGTVSRLMDRLSTLEKTVQTQVHVIDDLEKELESQKEHTVEQVLLLNTTAQLQDSQIHAQQNNFEKQQEFIKNQTDKINDLDHKNEKQGKQLNEQSVTIKDQNSRLRALENRMDICESTSKNHKDLNSNLKHQVDGLNIQLQQQTQLTTKLQEKESFTVVYSSGYNAKDAVTNGEPLLFSDPIFESKPKHAYNYTTGVFTVPRDGLYVFELSAMVRSTAMNGFLYIDLQANGVTLGTLEIHQLNQWDHYSVSIVAPLVGGDAVTPIVKVIHGVIILENMDKLTRFSGYLIQLY